MRKVELIDKVVDPVTDDFFVPQNCTICVDGVLVDEQITLNYIGMNGTDLTPVYDDFESVAVLKLTRPAYFVITPIHLRIAKPLTTNPVGIYYIIM